MPKTKVVTPIFRASFISLFEKSKPMQNSDGSQGKPQYEITMLFTPASFSADDKKRYAQMKKIADEACVEKFKKPLDKVTLGNFKRPFRDGAEKEHLGGYGEGVIFAKATSFNQPAVVASDKVTRIEDPEAIYPGCYCRASVTAGSYDKNGGKGVKFYLSNVMFVRDGERLDSRTDPEEDFGELPTEDSDSDDLT